LEQIHNLKRSPGLSRVKDLQLSEKSSCLDVMTMLLDSGGFVGRLMAEGVEILAEMHRKQDCTNFLSIPAAPIATGLRGVIREMLKRKIFDVVIAASGVVDHDIARCWANYYKGDFQLDDAELEAQGIHRLGNVLVPKESYGPLIEAKVADFLLDIYERGMKKVTTSQLCKQLGYFLNSDESVLTWCSRNDIPVILPGPMDGAFGAQTWFFSQTKKDFSIDLLGDEELLSKIVFESKKSGALMIGGGITKHHTLWWNQFRGGLDYAVYITTATEYDGSLSGAEVREAVSWGKVKKSAGQVTIHADATSVLPFMAVALFQKIATAATKRGKHR
jgi:deoxyhypusine synthase